MNDRKKVLIVTYYWPPAGGISLLRCLKFAKYLRDFGWEPVVYTAKDAQYPYFDESNFKDIPDHITVLKRPILEPFGIFKKLSGRKKEDSLNNIIHVRDKKSRWIDDLAIWIRGNLFIPDARALWIRPSVRYLSRYLKQNRVDAVLSDGPPHTNTMIALHLSKKLGIPFLADFQDPWTQVDYYPLMKLTSWADKKHRRMEQEVFRQADKITIASQVWKQDLEAIGARNVDVVYWGYDEDDFADIPVSEETRKFTITHAGLMGIDRLPEVLFRVLSEICSENKEFRKQLRLQFPGQLDYAVIESLHKYELHQYLAEQGFKKRPVVLEMLCNSSMLLLLLNKASNASGRVPGKFFEYLRARRPILCLGPRKGDVGTIISETESGKVLPYTEETQIKDFIMENFEAFQKQQYITPKGKISTYSVKNQTAKVAGFLDEITQPSTLTP